MKALLIAAVLTLASGLTQAQSLHLVGTTGYASEWALNGEVTQAQSGPAQEFSGPLTFKHVGLCSVNGPLEKSGEIKFQISRSGSSSRIKATVFYEGAWCAYSGGLASSSSHGFMRCSETEHIPITLTLK